jgi:hypothetical protein
MIGMNHGVSNEGRPMTTVQALPRRVLYEHDETAWLETMAELIRLGRLDEIDYPNLAEYLADMARRDRREGESRLTVLIVHALSGSIGLIGGPQAGKLRSSSNGRS